MKKILLISLLFTLAMPQPTYALRPMASAYATRASRNEYPESLEDFEGYIREIAQEYGLYVDTETKIILYLTTNSGRSVTHRPFTHLFKDRKKNVAFVTLEVKDNDELSTIAEHVKRSKIISGLLVGAPYKNTLMHCFETARADRQTKASIIVKEGAEYRAVINEGIAWVEWFKKEVKEVTELANKRVVLLGAGGTGRPIAESLAGEKPKQIIITDIDENRAKETVASLEQLGVDAVFYRTGSNELYEALEEADIVINATGLGREPGGDISPIETPRRISSEAVVVDLNHRPAKNRFLADAEQYECTIYNGLGYFCMVNAFHFRTFYNQMFDDHIAPQEIQEIYKIFYEYATRDMGLQEAKSFPQREIVAAIEGSVLESAIEKAADYFKTWKDVVSKRRTYVQDPVSNELVKLLLRIKRKLSRRRLKIRLYSGVSPSERIGLLCNKNGEALLILKADRDSLEKIESVNVAEDDYNLWIWLEQHLEAKYIENILSSPSPLNKLKDCKDMYVSYEGKIPQNALTEEVRKLLSRHGYYIALAGVECRKNTKRVEEIYMEQLGLNTWEALGVKVVERLLIALRHLGLRGMQDSLIEVIEVYKRLRPGIDLRDDDEIARFIDETHSMTERHNNLSLKDIEEWLKEKDLPQVQWVAVDRNGIVVDFSAGLTGFGPPKYLCDIPGIKIIRVTLTWDATPGDGSENNPRSVPKSIPDLSLEAIAGSALRPMARRLSDKPTLSFLKERAEMAARRMGHRRTFYADVTTNIFEAFGFHFERIIPDEERKVAERLRHFIGVSNDLNTRLFSCIKNRPENPVTLLNELNNIKTDLEALLEDLRSIEHILIELYDAEEDATAELRNQAIDFTFTNIERAIAILEDSIALAEGQPGRLERVNVGELLRDDDIFVGDFMTVADDVYVDGVNRLRLLEVVENLIANAKDHAEAETTTVSVTESGGFCVIDVTDDGVGIPAYLLADGETPDRPKVFELNITTRDISEPGEEGGLGSALVWHFKNDHDAYINIISKPGEGTKVTIGLAIEPATSRDGSENNPRSVPESIPDLSLEEIAASALRPMAKRLSKVHEETRAEIALEDLDLTKAKRCGKGGYAIIFKAPHKDSGLDYAVKVYNELFDFSKEDIFPSIDYMMNLCRQNPQLVNAGRMPYYYTKGECYLENDMISTAQTASRPYPYVILDLMPGKNLESLLFSRAFAEFKKEKSRSQADIENAFVDNLRLLISIAKAISAYHKEGLMIKDLKPTNIMVGPDYKMCLLDQDSVVPIGYDWEKDPMKIPDMVKKMRTDLFAEEFHAFGGSDIDFNTAKQFFTKQRDIYSFGLIMFVTLEYQFFSQVVHETSTKGLDIYTFMEYIRTRIDEQIDQFQPFSENEQLNNAATQMYQILKRCIAPDRRRRYADMDSIIGDLEELSGDAFQGATFQRSPEPVEGQKILAEIAGAA